MGCACRPIPFPPPPKTTASACRRYHYHHPPPIRLFPLQLQSSYPFTPLQNPTPPLLRFSSCNTNNNNHHNGGGNNGGNGGGWENFSNSDENEDNNNPLLVFLFSNILKNENSLISYLISKYKKVFLFLIPITTSVSFCYIFASLANAIANGDENRETVCDIRGGKRVELVPDFENDEFIVPKAVWQFWSKSKSKSTPGDVWMECRDLFMNLMLPEGFPDSVTSDYLQYSLWRGVQGIAAQISGVLATQALLYAVGLGKGAIPTAAALNWVLKDGIGYLSKILLSKYGRHFDVNPKGWRLFADLLENAAYGMEIITPAFPHLFVPIGAAAGAGRSAAALIQAATRSCFYAGFAAQRNFAEVIAKGEAQGMVSKSIGIMLGIALANCIQSSTPIALASFSVITWIHMFCNLKSYQSIQLRTLNPYRASIPLTFVFLFGCLLYLVGLCNIVLLAPIYYSKKQFILSQVVRVSS